VEFEGPSISGTVGTSAAIEPTRRLPEGMMLIGEVFQGYVTRTPQPLPCIPPCAGTGEAGAVTLIYPSIHHAAA